MSAFRLLEGEVADPDDTRLDDLETENRDLRRQLARAEQAATDARVATTQALSALRRQLSPLYRALQAVFGELDAAGVDDVAGSTGAAQTPASKVWESWKAKLGGQCAKVIDVLLTHGEMNTTQLAIAIGTRRQNIPNLIYKLNQAGLINKNGGRFSLKPLQG
jgi:hypothetical protein